MFQSRSGFLLESMDLHLAGRDVTDSRGHKPKGQNMEETEPSPQPPRLICIQGISSPLKAEGVSATWRKTSSQESFVAMS
jgi:hypothetical protein